MNITFGLNFDGGSWPEFEPGCDALLGDVVLGQQGLIGLLETHLGLGEEPSAQAIRIRRYMGRLQGCLRGGLHKTGDASPFYAASFAADAWSTARELLVWRDALIFGGWNPEQGDAPSRLKALAAVEGVAADPLPPGFADRFRSVLKAVENGVELPIASIVMVEPMAMMPAPWKRLFLALAQSGISIKEVGESPKPTVDQVVLLSSEHEGVLGQVVAAWLKTEPETASSVILCQQNSGKLDEALKKQGLPQTGQGEESAQKGVLQLLPLVLENLWNPVRIEHLVELLSAPYSPVPAFAAKKLLYALTKEMGLEGAKWREAMEEISTAKCAFLIKDGIAPDQAELEAKRFADDLDRWLKRDRLDINADNLSVTVIADAIQRLQRHLAHFQYRVPLASIAMRHCHDLATIITDLGTITKPLLDRIVDDVIGPNRSGGSVREAASWGVMDDAGQLCGAVDTLIWWGFNDHSAPAAHIWTNKERAWLQASAVDLDEPKHLRARERFHWRGCLHRCKRLLLCRTTIHAGVPAIVHPLWGELKSDPTLSDKLLELSALTLLQQPQPKLLGQVLACKPSESPLPKQIESTKDFAVGAFDQPKKLSPTSLGSLFGCAFKWLLEQLEISASDMMKVQQDSALTGTLAHQVLEDIFTAGLLPDPNDAAQHAAQQFDLRVPEMAANLLLPENSVEYAVVRSRVVSAASDLAARFAKAGFTRLECEKWVHTLLDGIKVNGRADVIAYNDKDEPHIIDFKYSYARNYYQGKIEKGRDIQLITYSRMLDNSAKPVAYYLIPLQQMVTAFSEFGSETVEIRDTLDEGWSKLCKTYTEELQQLRAGNALASGLIDEDGQKKREEERDAKGMIHESPPCRFCDYGSLCGVNRERNNA